MPMSYEFHVKRIEYSGSPITLASIVAAGNVLLSTAPKREYEYDTDGYFSIMNMDANTIYLVIDDGTDTGTYQSCYPVASGGVAGGQGAFLSSTDIGPHSGRIRVYGKAGALHSLRT